MDIIFRFIHNSWTDLLAALAQANLHRKINQIYQFNHHQGLGLIAHSEETVLRSHIAKVFWNAADEINQN